MNNLGSKRLETDRLILKAQTMKEQKYLWSILLIPEINKYYLTVPSSLREKLKDWDKQEKYYIEDMKHANDLDVYKWSIFLKETNICIGRISCQESHDEKGNVNEPSIRDIGWYIDPKYQGLGYCTEAAKTMIKFMFNKVKINEIRTGAAIDNPASWKIMEKLGFNRTNNIVMANYTYLDNPVKCYQYILTKDMYLKN